MAVSQANPTSTATEPLDPRVRRTRELLQQALGTLLDARDFDKLSVQDITDAAGLNRATFYAHYPDKFALLECTVASRFHALLAARGIVFNGSCPAALHGIILGVCDFVTQTVAPCDAQCPSAASVYPHHPMVPPIETAIVSVVRSMLLDGLRQHPSSSGDTPELLSATASWAMYGAVKEWVRTPNRPPSQDFAATVQRLISPLLSPPPAPASPAPSSPGKTPDYAPSST